MHIPLPIGVCHNHIGRPVASAHQAWLHTEYIECHQMNEGRGEGGRRRRKRADEQHDMAVLDQVSMIPVLHSQRERQEREWERQGERWLAS